MSVRTPAIHPGCGLSELRVSGSYGTGIHLRRNVRPAWTPTDLPTTSPAFPPTQLLDNLQGVLRRWGARFFNGAFSSIFCPVKSPILPMSVPGSNLVRAGTLSNIRRMSAKSLAFFLNLVAQAQIFLTVMFHHFSEVIPFTPTRFFYQSPNPASLTACFNNLQGFQHFISFRPHSVQTNTLRLPPEIAEN